MSKMNHEDLAEQNRNIHLGASLVEGNSDSFILIWTGKSDGKFNFCTNSRTWAMGAVVRAGVAFEEQERIDTLNHGLGRDNG